MKDCLIFPSEAKQAIQQDDLLLFSGLHLSKGKVYGKKGKTLLHYLAKFSNDISFANYCTNKLKVNPNAQTKKGKVAPLHIACKYGKTSMAEFLLNLPNINRDVQDADGETALSIATKYNQTDLAIMLIQGGVQINSKNKQGWTPLHWASKKGNLFLTTMFIQSGLNPNSVTKQNENCLHLAVESGCVYTVEALSKYVLPLGLSNKGTLIHHSYLNPSMTDYLLLNTVWKDFPKLHILIGTNAPVEIIIKHALKELTIQSLNLIVSYDRADVLQVISSKHLISEKTIIESTSQIAFGKCQDLLKKLNRWQSVKKILFVHKFSMKTTVNLPQSLLRELIFYI